MIEFCGKFSEESKNYLLKKLAKGAFYIALVVSLVFGIITFIVASVLDLWIITLFLIPLILIIIFAMAAPYIERTKTLDNMLPVKISIDENGTIEAVWKTRFMVKSISDVKKVIDTGTCYYVIFYFPKASDFICQKNLITKGTLEAFEKIFEGKIVKTSKKLNYSL